MPEPNNPQSDLQWAFAMGQIQNAQAARIKELKAEVERLGNEASHYREEVNYRCPAVCPICEADQSHLAESNKWGERETMGVRFECTSKNGIANGHVYVLNGWSSTEGYFLEDPND